MQIGGKKQPTQSVRQSNLELLRIVAMFLVLVVHADYFALGAPTLADVTDMPLPSFVRIFIESLSIVCVNVFILISGWFGIRPKFKSITNFLFQCLFFLVGIYAIGVLTGFATLSPKGLAGCLCLIPWNWFIKAYLVFLSSVLLLLAFHRLRFQSKVVNWIAASSFAVFLLHTNPNLCVSYFIPLMNNLYADYSGVMLLLTMLFVLALIFMIAVLFDQVRIIVYRSLQPFFEKIAVYFN